MRWLHEAWMQMAPKRIDVVALEPTRHKPRRSSDQAAWHVSATGTQSRYRRPEQDREKEAAFRAARVRKLHCCWWPASQSRLVLPALIRLSNGGRGFQQAA